MTFHGSSWRTICRRGLAAFVALMVLIAAVPFGAQAGTAAVSNGVSAVAVVKNTKTQVPKPCRNNVIPSTANTCPMSSVGLGAVASIFPDTLFRAASDAARWRLNNSSLLAQCGGFSPYRPPCLNA